MVEVMTLKRVEVVAIVVVVEVKEVTVAIVVEVGFFGGTHLNLGPLYHLCHALSLEDVF
jgi:hypothetical protein